jgi:capsid protein
MNATLQRLAVSLLPPILVPKAWSSVYDNAQNSPRRGPVPGASPRDARKDLTPAARRELVRRSRYLYKNSGFVREMVSSMAIYSTGDGIRPQAQSPDPDWNQRAEDYFKRWGAGCEVTGRFSFEECQGLVCRGLDIDGEYFVMKTRNRLGLPSLQLIETHRIGDDEYAPTSVDGVTLDDWGAPQSYRLIEDGGHRDVPAYQMLHVFEPEHSSAVRSAPTIQHSINHVIDEMELLALEKHAVKDNADVTRVLKNQAGALEEGTDFEFRDGDAALESDNSNPTDLQRIVGGKLVALKPNESLESFESKRPSPTFTGFLEHLRRDSALGVLPFEFAADSSKIGGAGVRLVVAKADRRFSLRQMTLVQRLIRPVWFYVIGDAIDRGELEAVPNWWRISCVRPKRLSVDAGRESQQNRADVEMGLKTISTHYEELGADFGEEIERRARDVRMILDAAKKHGVPVELLWKPAGELAPVDSGNGT